MTATKKIIALMTAVVLAVAALGIGIGAYATSQAEKKSIGQDKALEIALSEAGVAAENASYTKVKLDRDDGYWVYEVEFYADGLEYDFAINSTDGKIIKKEIDGRKVDAVVSQRQSSAGQPSQSQSTQQSARTYGITLEKAKEIALRAAGVSSADAQFTKGKLETDDGRMFYEVDFYAGGYEYDYKIAMDGRVLEAEKEKRQEYNSTTASDSLIGVDKAKQIALSHSGAPADGVYFEKAKLEMDDGRTYYEIEFRFGVEEYEYDIDAVTGEILSFDRDTDD